MPEVSHIPNIHYVSIELLVFQIFLQTLSLENNFFSKGKKKIEWNGEKN